MKLLNTYISEEEKQMSEQNRLLNIMRLERRLFSLIEDELAMLPSEEKDALRLKINSMQSEYSRISI